MIGKENIMKKTAFTLLLSILFTFALSSCGAQQAETPKTTTVPETTAQMVSPTEAAQKNPYFNNDYSVRFFKSKYTYSDVNEVYNNTVFFCQNMACLMQRSFATFDPEIRDGRLYEPSGYEGLGPLCSDPACTSWNTVGSKTAETCPAMLWADNAMYLVDAHESAGGYPILYIAYPTDSHDEKDENGKWVTHQSGFYLSRYDTASNERKAILTLRSEIITMIAVYDNLLFYISHDEDALYSATILDKSGNKLASSSKRELELDLIGYYNGALYYADYAGNVYRLDKETQKDEKVFTVPGLVIFEYLKDNNPTRTFIHGEYLYYDKAKWTEVNVINDSGNPQTWLHPVGPIYRVPLSDFSAEPQLVAENVFDSFIYGIVGDDMYYGKFEIGEHDPGCNWDFIGGKIWKTNLQTLETTLFKDNMHVMFVFQCSFFNERFCVGEMMSATKDYKVDNESFKALFDFETGKLIELKRFNAKELTAYLQGETDE